MEYLLYFLAFLIVLWLLSKIPGFSLLIPELVKAISSLAHWLAVSIFEYGIWIVKRVWSSHFILVKHLLSRRKDISSKEQVYEKEKKL
jgi:hypothetical protein